MQTAKVSAGNFLHAAEDAETVRDDLRIKILEGKKLTNVDLSAVDYSTAAASGDLVATMSFVIPAAMENIHEGRCCQERRCADRSARRNDTNKSLIEFPNLYSLIDLHVSNPFCTRSGGCIVDEDGCVSPDIDSDGLYLRGDTCSIEITGGTTNL